VRSKEKIGKFIRANLLMFDDTQALGDNDNFFESGFVDSSFAMELVCFVEDEFNLSVTDEDLELKNFSSINRVAQFVSRKIGN
jgi:acyl carrier protein